MAEPAEVAGDIVTAGSAVSGLLLVYIGALATGFASFEPQERRAVVGRHQRRAEKLCEALPEPKKKAA